MLKIRGARDFKTREQYEAFIRDLVERRNRRVSDKYKLEQRQLQPLPRSKSINSSEHYVTVTRTSNIVIKCVTYTVPSRLIQSRLLIRVYDNHLTLFLGQEQVSPLQHLRLIPLARVPVCQHNPGPLTF